MRRIVLAVALVLAFAAPVSAKPIGTCSVTPNPVTVNAPLTVTASADVQFSFHITDPNGVSYSFPISIPDTVSYTFTVSAAGDWTVTVNYVKRHLNAQRIGSCSFEVLP